MKRESGYYWVKAVDTQIWEIASWNELVRLWHRIGRKSIYTDVCFIEINETKIPEP